MFRPSRARPARAGFHQFAGALILLFTLAARVAPAAEPATPDDASAEVAALVAEALQKNPDVLAARQEAAASAARVGPAGALPDPMVTVGYENDGAAPSLGTEPMTRLAFVAQQAFPFPGSSASPATSRRRTPPGPARGRSGLHSLCGRCQARVRRPSRGPRGDPAGRRAARDVARHRRGHPRPVRGWHGHPAGHPPGPKRADCASFSSAGATKPPKAGRSRPSGAFSSGPRTRRFRPRAGSRPR